MSIITSIDIDTCRLPLDHVIKFRWHQISYRDYTVVRLNTRDGNCGVAIGLSRSAPIDFAIHDLIAPAVLGLDATQVGLLNQMVARTTGALDQGGVFALARSLVDIACWDIKSKALEVPLWQLFGGDSTPADVLLVEGYEIPGESDEAFARRLAARVAEGYRLIKIEASGYRDIQVLRRRIELVREYSTPHRVGLIVDVNGGWSTIIEAVRAIEGMADTTLSWVEDPFPRPRISDTGKLRRRVAVPVGTGDEITDPRVLMELMIRDAVDVIRVDTTTLGGYDATRDVVGLARHLGIPVSTHAHPVVHQHLAFAWPDVVGHVEVFPDNLPFEPSYKLLESPIYPRVAEGKLPAPLEPGVGFALNMKVVEETSIRKLTARL